LSFTILALLARSSSMYRILLLLFCTFIPVPARAQSAETLRLSDAVRLGQAHYPGIAAKRSLIEAARGQAQTAHDSYLPDVTLAAQQSYGTVNGLYGPQSSIGFLAPTSSGPTGTSQSWNAAFGGNYLLGASWEFFTFGRVSSRIDLANAGVQRADADLQQEQFAHSVRIASTYLDLLAARALIEVAHSNLSRAQAILEAVQARTRSGLSADVDRSLADAEVSRAKLALIDAQDRTQQLETQLSVFVGEHIGDRALDSQFLEDLPEDFGPTTARVDDNPQIKLQNARITEAESAVRVAKRSVLPGFTLTTAAISRASGFDPDYTAGSDHYTLSYFDGIRPRRFNYVLGITFSWNLMSLIKNRGQIDSQAGLAESYRSEKALSQSQLDNQRERADQRIANVQNILREVPHQYEAADAAYRQKNALYRNGLSNIVEVQQALYALNRAEADRSVSHIALWSALLQKTAAVGDYHMFSSQLGSK